jgi:uncharacterized phage-like protein YoqJ
MAKIKKEDTTPKSSQVCAECYWWKEHASCRKTEPTDSCKDFKDRKSTCGTCKFFRKKVKCENVSEWDTCNYWEIGELYAVCNTCLKEESCTESQKQKGTCDNWQPKAVKKETAEKHEKQKKDQAPTTSRIKDMIQQGMNPQEIADALGIKLACTEVVVDLKTSPDSILKSNLVTTLNLLQLAELNYKQYMTATNLSAVNETISTVQSLVKDLQAYQDPLKFYNQLDEIVIQEATKAYLQILTTGLHETRLRLFELIPIQRQSVAQRIFADFFDGVAANLKAQYTDLRRVLARTLGVESQVEYLNTENNEDRPRSERAGSKKLTRGDTDDKVGYEFDRDDDRQ